MESTKQSCIDCKFLAQGEHHCFCANPLNKDERLRNCVLSCDIDGAPKDCGVFEAGEFIGKNEMEKLGYSQDRDNLVYSYYKKND